MKRPIALTALFLFIFSIFAIWSSSLPSGGILAYLPSSFVTPSATTRAFRRKTTRTITSVVPCRDRPTEAKCTENNAGTVCYWDTKNHRCTTSLAGCSDGDGGLDFYHRTTVYGPDDAQSTVADAHEDVCGSSGRERGKLKEYYCDSSGYVAVQLYSCSQRCASGSCSLASADFAAGIFPPMQQPLLVWPVGKASQDPVRVSSFEEEVSLLSQYAMLLQRVAPDVTVCAGDCTFEVTLTDRVAGVIAKATRRTTNDTDLAVQFTLPVRLEAKRTYVLQQKLTSTSSMTLRTGTEDPGAQARMRVQVISSKTDGKDRTDGAGMAFTLQGSFAE
jgi:hypothetical protein